MGNWGFDGGWFYNYFFSNKILVFIDINNFKCEIVP